MDIVELLNQGIMPIITIICLCIGYIMKHWIKDVDNRIIPTVVLIVGIVLAAWISHWTITPEILMTGTGIMVGSPGQTIEHLVEDLLFIERFQPEMIGIGPFIPHADTPFAHAPAGSIELTLKLIAIFRLMHPSALIPATTALASLSADGRERGILSGANVVMPNLSPSSVREKYTLYNHKAAFGSEAAEGLKLLEEQLNLIGYTISKERGDYNYV